MEGFDHILNWKLKAGSHPFPGKDGGTCINEAALVAAGFPYRPVRSILDMPPCFSRPICSLAMLLNDEADDAERQRLMPFVTRLACADTPEVERRRAAYIDVQIGFSDLYPRRARFERGLRALEGALAIGRQADSIAFDAMRDRMDVARTQPEAAAQRKGGTLSAKLNAWFGLTKAEPAE
ncbi:hypothetical protein [Methylobacterium nigriterrae]|uniref:hypothetical protein n=1 Tax=Methylobacterium nigriterrae TaxID=3127512 RepID=UPI0030141419